MRYAAAMHELTLTLLSGPGRPLGDSSRRIRVQLALDQQGAPDPRAWRDDPEPWRAWLEAPDAPDRSGDIQYEEDFGWYFRMPEGGNDLADATTWVIHFPDHTPARPGETVITRGPEGEDWAWRIVAVEATPSA